MSEQQTNYNHNSTGSAISLQKWKNAYENEITSFDSVALFAEVNIYI